MRSSLKKLILWSLALLAVNIVVELLAVAALLLFLVKGDSGFAILPALLALPAVILQPWFILFMLPPIRIFAPIPTTAVTVVIYTILDREGKLERVKSILSGMKRIGAAVFLQGIELDPCRTEVLPPGLVYRFGVALASTPVEARSRSSCGKAMAASSERGTDRRGFLSDASLLVASENFRANRNSLDDRLPDGRQRAGWQAYPGNLEPAGQSSAYVDQG